ncbi:hypothetical protein [Methanobrevibacter sp. DSM 116169]|uniref:hypothetical protein n=1 Tax=Methanobrevibacter sp. DSM 116169 TaxID=3242727 RepID=UPI0038FD1715
MKTKIKQILIFSLIMFCAMSIVSAEDITEDNQLIDDNVEVLLDENYQAAGGEVATPNVEYDYNSVAFVGEEVGFYARYTDDAGNPIVNHEVDLFINYEYAFTYFTDDDGYVWDAFYSDYDEVGYNLFQLVFVGDDLWEETTTNMGILVLDPYDYYEYYEYDVSEDKTVANAESNMEKTGNPIIALIIISIGALFVGIKQKLD